MEMSSLGACIPKYVRFVSVALLFCFCGGVHVAYFISLSLSLSLVMLFFMLISGVLGV